MTVLLTHLDGLVPGIALGVALFTVITLFLRLVRTTGEADLRRDVLENVHDAVYVIRLSDAKFILVNRRFEELFGVSAEDAKSGTITPLDLVAPEDRGRIAERMASRRSGEDRPHLYEFRAVTRSGETRHVEVDTVPVVRRGERLVFGICRDVTEKRRAQDAVREEHERLLTIFDGIDEVIYVADMETYEVLYANRRARDLAGEDPVGKTCCTTIHQQDAVAPCSTCPNQSLRADGDATGPLVWEFTNPQDGRTYRCMDRALRWPDGRMVRFELAVDITEQKQLEERVRQDQKLEALGTLVEGISHEFNNLLSAIVGYASLALARLEDGAPGKREVERIT
ncbi:MAG: PAS domain S-box protein, partial [Planctomycetota bacterium]